MTNTLQDTAEQPSLFERLRAAAGTDWADYTEHDFVTKLGDGSLPLPAFQDYLVQDYLFLLQFARANALAVYKSRGLADMQRASDALGTTLHETRLHIGMAERWGVSPAELEQTEEKQATVAYTRNVLDTAMTGDLLDLHTALAPCTIGYAEIGSALAPALAQEPEHPYREWIAAYAGDEYQTAAAASVASLDAHAEGLLTQRRLDALIEIFRTATTLETAFWQQSLEIR